MSKVTCHDGSPFLNYQCPSCSFIMHVHLTQLLPGYQNLELRTFCKNCGEELIIPQPTTGQGVNHA